MRYKKNNNFKRRKIVHSIPIGCMLALLLLGGICINPTGFSNSMNGGIGSNGSAYAEEGLDAQADGMSVSLRMDGDANTLTNNSKTGQVNYISSGFTVTTANVDGYNVYVQTAPGSTNKLTNGSLTVDFVKVDTPTSEFTDNTWGYAVDSTGATPENLKYNPVPDSSTTALNPAYSSTSTGETRNFTINFATKFGANATPGHYTTGILLSAVAGAEEVTLSNLTYMQDMRSEICDKSYEHEIKQLIDSRNNKKYWVAKMKDGNCWMTQDLKLSLTSAGLKAADTDIATDWNSSAAYPPTDTITNKPSGFSGSTVVQSYNPGDYVYLTPAIMDDCGALAAEAPFSTCAEHGWAAVPSWQFKESDVDDMPSVIDYAAGTYNAHFEKGFYYSWFAATAGTGSISSNQYNAPGSICPKNWQLPLGGTQKGKSWNDLFVAYGYKYPDNIINVSIKPIYLLRGGRVFQTSKLANVGDYIYYWTATTQNVTSTYKYVYSINQNPVLNPNINFDSPETGLAVRCVAR